MSLTPQSSVDVPWHISDFQAIWKLASLEARIDMSKPQLGIGLLRYQGKTLPGKMLGVSVRTENKDLDWILQMGYLRGNDLMATYRNSSCPQSTLQIDWRISAVSADEVLLKIDVVVSMHTESLESYPHITATTRLACDQFLYVTNPQVNTQTTILSTATDAQVSRKSPSLVEQASVGQTTKEQASDSPGCAVYRLRNLPWSYVETVYPADFNQWHGSLSTNYCSQEGHLSAQGDRLSRWNLGYGLLEKGVIRRLQLRALLLPRQQDLPRARRSQAEFAKEKLPLTV